jgi:MFS family permease
LSRVTNPESQIGIRWPFLYLGISLTTLATLLLELSLTRIFSVVFYYHFAFLAISIALFGLGAGGVFSYVVAGWRSPLFVRLGALALVNALAVPASLTFLLTRRGQPDNLTLAAVYLATALPFFFAGAMVSLVIAETIERVDRVYFFDLIGAAGGCLLLVPLLGMLTGPDTVLSAGVLYAVAGAVWFTLARASRGRIAAVTLGLVLVAFVVVNEKARLLDVRYAKGNKLLQEYFVKWNSFSRIAVAPQAGSREPAIFIDADASTGIPTFNVDHLSPQDRRNLLLQGPGLPYALRPGAKTLIIGPGGGWDVTRALASGSKQITGVEINDIIVRIMRQQPYASLSHRLYFRPEVRIHIEDGRSFVRRSAEKFQVLQATLVDTWASTAAGAFALSENNLYTSDAFYDYLTHLTSDGLIALTRWGFEPPRESLRLLSLAVDALDQLGEKRPWRHVIVARENAHALGGWGATDTVLISRKPLGPEDVEQAKSILKEAGMQAIYLPGDQGSSPFAQLLRARDLDAFLDNYPYDVSSVDDNRPFFFYTVQPRDVWAFLLAGNQDNADFKINRAVPLLFALVGVSLMATAITLALPPILLGSRLPAQRGVRLFLLYFVCVGVGYILIQVALIQKFVLFLGHPTYALTVIVFSMLVASGIGSYWSRRLKAYERGRLRLVLLAVAALVTLLALVVGPLASAGVGWPFSVRVLVTILLIAPVGFAMGIPFPSGLTRLERLSKPAVRWAWSLNAASSVLGSAMAIFLALYLGLRETLLTGGALYLGALAVLSADKE